MKSEEEMRTSSYYKTFMDKNPTMAERIRKEISNTVSAELSKTVGGFVKNDPQYKQLFIDSLETVKANFPQMVQQAMVQHMAGQLPALVNQLRMLAQGVNDQVSNMDNRLIQRGI